MNIIENNVGHIDRYPDVLELILNYLDPFGDHKSLILVNKYYCSVVQDYKLLSQQSNSYYRSKQGIGTKVSILSNLFDVSDFIEIDCDEIMMNFMILCKSGEFESAKYIFYEYIHNSIVEFDREKLIHCMQKAFKSVCLNNNVAIAQWIYSLDLMDITNNVSIIATMMYKNCERGNLEIIKWLYSLEYFKHYFPLGNNFWFQTCCRCGQLEVAEWFLSFPNNIDIYRDNNRAFVWARQYGGSKIEKFLYKIDKERRLTMESYYQSDVEMTDCIINSQ